MIIEVSCRLGTISFEQNNVRSQQCSKKSGSSRRLWMKVEQKNEWTKNLLEKKSLKLNKNRQILKYFWLLNWKGGGMKFILRSACSISSLSLSLSLSLAFSLSVREGGWEESRKWMGIFEWKVAHSLFHQTHNQSILTLSTLLLYFWQVDSVNMAALITN